MLNVKKMLNCILDSFIPKTETITSHITVNTTNASITDARMTRVGRADNWQG